MSYILDALKKVEREKLRRAAPGGTVNISGELLHEQPRKSSGRSSGKIVALIVTAVLVAVAITMFVLKGDKKQKQTVVPTSQPVPAVMPPPVAPPVVAPVPSPPAISTPSSAITTVLPAAANKVPVEAPEDEDRSSRNARKRSKQLQTVPQTQTVPVLQTVQAPTDIQLSGIAWQDEHAARRAVVNGFLLKEGAVVAGAKIIEIQPDRVRFSAASGIFEIRLNSGQPVETKR